MTRYFAGVCDVPAAAERERVSAWDALIPTLAPTVAALWAIPAAHLSFVYSSQPRDLRTVGHGHVYGYRFCRSS